MKWDKIFKVVKAIFTFGRSQNWWSKNKGPATSEPEQMEIPFDYEPSSKVFGGKQVFKR